MMNDEEIVVKLQMKLLRESLTADMQKAMDALEVLYLLIDDGSESHVQAEMDKLLADYSETLQERSSMASVMITLVMRDQLLMSTEH